MFRLILRLSLLPLIFLSAALLFIRARPYDGRTVRSVLMPGDCSQPCFMGIQPGITHPEDAINQLRSSNAIARVGVSESLQTVAWFWDKTQSPMMDENLLPSMFYDGDAVSSIRLYTHIPLGDLLLELGQMPGKQRIAIRQTVPYNVYNVEIYYLGSGYILNATVNCHDFWTQPAHLILGAKPSYIESVGRWTTSLNTAKHQIAMTCRRLNQ